MSHREFTLEIGEFRGPLELLLDLIEQRKMDISDISLAAVSDEYVTYINNRDNVPLSETTQFLVVASTLLLIKSKALLPTIELTEEEEGDIRDLEERLRLYAHTRAVAKHLKRTWGDTQTYTTAYTPEKVIVFSPGADITLAQLTHTAQQLLDALPALTPKPTAHIERVVSLDEVIDSLTTRMQRVYTDSFKNITGTAHKVEAIVSFLALLELVKRGTLAVTQHAHFDDITLEHRT